MCKIHAIGLNQYGALRCTACLRCLSNEDVKLILLEMGPNNWQETYEALMRAKKLVRRSLGIPKEFDDIMDAVLINLNQ